MTAFYEEPRPGGSSSGVYYVNTIDMYCVPIFEMEMPARHERDLATICRSRLHRDWSASLN